MTLGTALLAAVRGQESCRDRTAIWYDEARGLGTPVWEVPRVQTTDLEESTCGLQDGTHEAQREATRASQYDEEEPL